MESAPATGLRSPPARRTLCRQTAAAKPRPTPRSRRVSLHLSNCFPVASCACNNPRSEGRLCVERSVAALRPSAATPPGLPVLAALHMRLAMREAGASVLGGGPQRSAAGGVCRALCPQQQRRPHQQQQREMQRAAPAALARPVPPSLRCRRRLQLLVAAAARKEGSTGLNRLEAPVPREQRPVNELQQLKDTPLLAWVSATKCRAGKPFGGARPLLGSLPSAAAVPHPLPPSFPFLALCRPPWSFPSTCSAWPFCTVACCWRWGARLRRRPSSRATRWALLAHTWLMARWDLLLGPRCLGGGCRASQTVGLCEQACACCWGPCCLPDAGCGRGHVVRLWWGHWRVQEVEELA